MIRRSVVLLVSIALFGAFLYGTHFFSSTERRMALHPDVVDLTAQGLEARIAFGPSPQCGDVDCWVLPEAEDQHWARAVLPRTDLSSLPGYDRGLEHGRVYYRILLEIPERLAAYDGIVSFTPMAVNHDYFEVYLDGRLVHLGSMDPPVRVANIALPKTHLRSGKVLVAVKASLSKAEVGIRHLGRLYLGPQAALDAVYVNSVHIGTTFWLQFLLVKGGIFLVFSMVYAFSAGKPELFAFLWFALASIGQDLLEGSITSPMLPYGWRVLGFFAVRGLSIGLIVWFAMTFLRRGKAHPALLLAFVAYEAVVIGLAANVGMGTQSVSVPDMLAVTHHGLEAALVLGIYLAWRTLRAPPAPLDRRQRRRLVIFAAFLAGYLLLSAWDFYLVAYRGPNLRPVAGVMFFLFMAFLVAEESGHNEAVIQRQVKDLAEARTDRAVAQAAQMLAHDVRKPLSLVRMMFQRARATQSLEEVHGLLDRFSPELEKSFTSVNAMIDDVMAVGAGAATVVEEQRIEEILRRAFAVVFADKAGDVRFEYRWHHAKLVLVDGERILRAVTNVLENAYQALPKDRSGRTSGTIRLSTADERVDGRSFVHLGILNSGSFVPPGERERLFEPFFTKGKKKGTGLGLAIARKAVQAHGGRIWCESDPDLGTEFHLLLPASRNGAAAGSERLPDSLEALPTVPDEAAREAPSASLPSGKPRVAVIDDSVFVRDSWLELAEDCDVVAFEDGDDFVEAIERDPALLDALSCIVTDYYFSNDASNNGVTLARRIKAMRALPILLSSDTTVAAEDMRGAIDAQIGKEPLPWSKLQEALTRRRSG